jgi:hypothetical protein
MQNKLYFLTEVEVQRELLLALFLLNPTAVRDIKNK